MRFCQPLINYFSLGRKSFTIGVNPKGTETEQGMKEWVAAIIPNRPVVDKYGILRYHLHGRPFLDRFKLAYMNHKEPFYIMKILPIRDNC